MSTLYAIRPLRCAANTSRMRLDMIWLYTLQVFLLFNFWLRFIWRDIFASLLFLKLNSLFWRTFHNNWKTLEFNAFEDIFLHTKSVQKLPIMCSLSWKSKHYKTTTISRNEKYRQFLTILNEFYFDIFIYDIWIQMLRNDLFSTILIVLAGALLAFGLLGQ